MGNVYKVGDLYYVEFEARGLKYQQLAGSDEAAARQLLESIEEKIRRGETNAVVRDIPVEIFRRNFLEYARQAYPLKTRKRLEQAFEHFGEFLCLKHSEILLLSGVTPKIIEDYRFEALKNRAKPWRINFTLLLLREVFEYAIKLGYLNDNPTLHIRFVADRNRRLPRNNLGREALAKGVSLFCLARVLRKDDILKLMPFFPLLRDPMAG